MITLGLLYPHRVNATYRALYVLSLNFSLVLKAMTG